MKTGMSLEDGVNAVQIPKYGQIRIESRLFCAPSHNLSSHPVAKSLQGHTIVPNTVASVPVFTILGTKIQKLVTTLGTRTLWGPYTLPLYTMQLNKAFW